MKGQNYFSTSFNLFRKILRPFRVAQGLVEMTCWHHEPQRPGDETSSHFIQILVSTSTFSKSFNST